MSLNTTLLRGRGRDVAGSQGKPLPEVAQRGRVALGGQATAHSCIACHRGFLIKSGEQWQQLEQGRLRLHGEIMPGGGRGAEQQGASWSCRGEGGGLGCPLPTPGAEPCSEAAVLVTPSVCHSIWWQPGCHPFICPRLAAGRQPTALPLRRGLEQVCIVIPLYCSSFNYCDLQ